MNDEKARVGDLVGVRAHPTVVRLEHLAAPGAAWLTESFVLTKEVKDHLAVLRGIIAGGQGCGAFLIGHYGAGKSHFLAYFARELESGRFVSPAPRVSTLSLVNYSAANRLEDVVCEHLGLNAGSGDRRLAWNHLLAGEAQGLCLMLDELSEFLRSKAEVHAFNEDIRFLQFLGEWAQDKPFWILAAMQEGIEHTGELEYSLYRKIKDRYPLRLLLTPAHVQTLISDSILIKRKGYADAVQALVKSWQVSLPGDSLDYAQLRYIYPLHPATLALLEEVRDRFSQARGVVDFVVRRLRGEPALGIEPFLERPWGELITPDAIVDHFRDLFEVQPEYLALNQQVFPWYEKHLSQLFDKPMLLNLAERLLKLLVLVYLSPARERLSTTEAVSWLAFSAVRLDPQRNRRVIDRVLTTLVDKGRFVASAKSGYSLSLRDDGAAALERQLKREMAELHGRDELIAEALVGLLPAEGFNPFRLPREHWQHRQVDWCYHPRPYSVWFGNAGPDQQVAGPALCLRLPWGDPQPAPGLYTLLPEPLQMREDFLELAALARLQGRSLSPEVAKRVTARLRSQLTGFATALRNTWLQASLVTPENKPETLLLRADKGLSAWLDNLALWVLKRIYPGFERFAPGYGPLPKEAWLRYVRLASEDDALAMETDEYVRLVREGYLAPMGLLRRHGRQYLPRANPERHELVERLTPLVERGVSPKTVYQHLAEPIYGLVPDQVTALLIFLLLQGEIEILKGKQSYRDYFETLPNPLHYDRIVPGQALERETLYDLQQLCEVAGIKPPNATSVISQRRAAERLAAYGRERIQIYEALRVQLQEAEPEHNVLPQLQQQMDTWQTLDKNEQALQNLEQFRYQAGAATAFIEREQRLTSLAQRLPRLLADWRRFLHLVHHPHLDAAAAVELRRAINSLGEPPSLQHPDELESWLGRIGEAYTAYKRDYSERHDRWWREQDKQPIWTWEPPPIARSRHLALDEVLQELAECRRQAQAQRCRASVNLDYQPLCNCGFDGERAPIVDLLARCTSLSKAIEKQTRLFFQQEQVKARMREWRNQGLEVNAGTLAYLEGEQAVPEVADLQLLDEHLAGLNLVTEVDTTPVLDLLTQRGWEAETLLQALAGQLRSYGARRLRFRPPDAAAHTPEPLILWCGEQALRHALPLPKGLGTSDLAVINGALRPEWVSARTLTRLMELGLDDAIVDRLLVWLIDGHLSLPTQAGSENPVAAVRELLGPEPASNAEQIAHVCETLYRHHHRLIRLAPEPWLARLQDLAQTPLPDNPPLPRLLADLEQAQWLIVDCLGSALVNPLANTLEELCRDWRPPTLQFTRSGVDSSTDGCYRTLLAANIQHPFEKINAIDELIHEDFHPLDELIQLARAKLKIAFKPLLKKLDAHRPLLIFADHGFRIDAEGKGYEHGGSSTPERLIPVWYFDSYTPSR